MKTHTSNYKNAIKTFGKEIDTIITYQINNDDIELGGEELNSVSLHYEGAILKSVMKQLDIDSNVDIPLNTVLNAQFGVKINSAYEYIDLGNFVVYKSEKQEDMMSYKITCYDKLLYSMKEYEDIGITYPITIRNYINAICTHLGLTFANINDNFANYDKEIPNELYLDSDGKSLGYTFRDVLDELSEVTASTICINDNDELEIRYITDTNDTINEEFLKDVNVNFGEKFGAINTIVLSRSAGADNIYYPEILPQNPYEFKISDNQIMNGNDRADYLPDIYAKLNGLEYYINDFSSPGITYYDLCDRYNVQIGDTTYSCVMLNDEINITQGLEENVYTEMPKETVTDYTKADKTDRKINQTYLMVDKQNGIIQSLVDKTVYVSDTKSGIGSVTLENAYNGQLYKLSIKGQINLLFPQSEENIYGYPLVPSDTLVPSNTLVPSSPVPYGNEILYPSNELFTKSSSLLIDDTEYKLDLDFLNYISNTVCDEFVYNNGECQIIRRVGIDSEGNKYALENEVVEPRKAIALNVSANSVIRLKSFDSAIYNVTYLLDNEYTQNFATQVEVSSSIEQTADSINLRVDSKLDSEEYTGANILLKINQDESEAKIKADKVKIEGYTTVNNGFSIDEEGNASMNNATMNNATVNGGTIKLSSTQGMPKFLLISSGDNNKKCEMDFRSFNFINGNYNMLGLVENAKNFGLYLTDRALSDISLGNAAKFTRSEFRISDGSTRGRLIYGYTGSSTSTFIVADNNGITTIYGNSVNSPAFNNTSKAELKKNIKIVSGALKILNEGDIYSYNWKTESNTDKKHYGLVIGDKYNTPNEIISATEDSIDTYSMISIAWQAMKELNEKVEKLEKEIEVLKNGR